MYLTKQKQVCSLIKKVTGTIWKSDVFQKDRFRYFVKDRNKISQLEMFQLLYIVSWTPPPRKKNKKTQRIYFE